METRNENIKIEDFEDKKYGEGAKAGRYTRFKTSAGWISSFDKATIEALKDAEGKNLFVEIVTDKNGKDKITKVLKDAPKDDSDDEALNVVVEKIGKTEAKPRDFAKDPVGLAVEIFCAKELSIEEAIKAVQKARDAFK